MPRVDDPDDPGLADYRHLTDAAARRSIEGADGRGIFVVEGRLALRQLLRSRFRIRSILVAETRAGAVTAELEGAPDPVATVGLPVMVAPRSLLEAVTGFDVHRGVLAAADRAPLPEPEQVLPRCRRLVVAVEISDTENLGALFRNAAALGMDGVVLDQRSADPLYRRCIRVSSGWTLRLPYCRLGHDGSPIGTLRSHGFRPVALTPDPAALDVDRAAEQGLLDDPLALVVGAEGAGLPSEVIDACHAAVRVPMSGEVDSLNVATSLAVVAAFAAARRSWT